MLHIKSRLSIYSPVIYLKKPLHNYSPGKYLGITRPHNQPWWLSGIKGQWPGLSPLSGRQIPYNSKLDVEHDCRIRWSNKKKKKKKQAPFKVVIFWWPLATQSSTKVVHALGFVHKLRISKRGRALRYNAGKRMSNNVQNNFFLRFKDDLFGPFKFT